MIEKIIEALNDVSLSKEKGRFLADKSYGFDTIFFLSKFILHNCENGQFNKKLLRKKAISFTEDIFQLSEGTAGAVNYFLETVNLLDFANVVEKTGTDTYTVKHRDILEYITATPENAYIFNYLTTYQTFKNDGLTDLFERYCRANSVSDKEIIIKDLYREFCKKSISIQTTDTQWSKQLVKYALIVLGFINEQYEITRELAVKNTVLKIKDISLNVEGTRTPIYLPKKNDYLQNFNVNYVKYHLKNYLCKSFAKTDINSLVTVDSLADNLADLKLAMLDDKVNGVVLSDFDKEQYIINVVKTRNQSIQHQFRKGLLDNNEHKCPICGFAFENFLIASHIKPYSKCDDTYDAINHFNGFLLCPNHDRLFEGAEFMTIDAKTGKIILSEAARNSPEYGDLHEKFISRSYVENERRHYLKWHNETFFSRK